MIRGVEKLPKKCERFSVAGVRRHLLAITPHSKGVSVIGSENDAVSLEAHSMANCSHVFRFLCQLCRAGHERFSSLWPPPSPHSAVTGRPRNSATDASSSSARAAANCSPPSTPATISPTASPATECKQYRPAPRTRPRLPLRHRTPGTTAQPISDPRTKVIGRIADGIGTVDGFPKFGNPLATALESM